MGSNCNTGIENMLKYLFLLLSREIGMPSIILLVIAGLFFGMAFTYSHFWAIRKFVLKSPHFKKVIFRGL